MQYIIYSLPGSTAAVVWPISLWNSQENLLQNLISDLLPLSVQQNLALALNLNLPSVSQGRCKTSLRWS